MTLDIGYPSQKRERNEKCIKGEQNMKNKKKKAK